MVPKKDKWLEYELRAIIGHHIIIKDDDLKRFAIPYFVCGEEPEEISLPYYLHNPGRKEWII